MPALARALPIGRPARIYAREFYSHSTVLVSASVPGIEWTPPGGAVNVVGPHENGVARFQFAVDANGCSKSAAIYLYRDETQINSIGVGQCGDSGGGNLCEALWRIPANNGGRYSVRFREFNCGTRNYSSALRHIWIPSKYPPDDRMVRQADPTRSLNVKYNGDAA